MTQATQNNKMEYDPSKLQPYLELNPKANNDILYSLCGAITDSEKGYIRKKKSRILERIEVSESPLNEVLDSKKDKVSIKIKIPEGRDITKNHALELIQKYPELPLFIYSKLYERINKEYFLPGSYSNDEIKALGKDYDIEFEKLTYSFYDLYMELFEDINKGKYNRQIEIYMKDILKSYGDTYCNDFYGLPFDKSKLEEPSYWSEEEAKEWLEKQLIENPKYSIETNTDLEKLNDHDKNHAKLMVEEGIYVEDYSNVVKDVLEVIANTIDRTLNELEIFEPLTYDRVRIIPLIHIMFDYRQFNIFDGRPNEYIRGDLLKLYIEMRRKKIDVGFIPCSIDYQDNITCIYDIYREYDVRWIGMNEPERFLQYKTDPTKE